MGPLHRAQRSGWAGERAVLRFEKFLAAGSAEIRGSFNGGKVPPPALLKKASSSGRLYSLLSPRLELRRDGVLAAVAYGTFPWDIRKIILDAAAADDPAPLEKALAGPRPFRIDGLPDGNYEARVISFGAPDRERKVRLEGGKPLIWDLELGPEAPLSAGTYSRMVRVFWALALCSSVAAVSPPMSRQ